MTREEIIKLARQCVAMLVAHWPDASWEPETRQAYGHAFMELEERAGELAIALVHTCKFRPTVAELRERAALMLWGEPQTGLGAWGIVERAIRRYGRYRPPSVRSWQFRDKLIQRVVDGMGWTSLCDSTNEVSDRARFADEYDRLSKQERSRLLAAPRLASDGASGLLPRGETPAAVFERAAPAPAPELASGPPGGLAGLLAKIGQSAP